MQMIIKFLLVTSLIAGNFCQKITFDNITLLSPCETGARSRIDRYFIAGTIGENITELLTQRWQPFMSIQMLRTSSSQPTQMCLFLIIGATCDPSPTPKCWCFYNTITDQVHFTVNDTVHADDSNSVISAQWQHMDGIKIYSDEKNTLWKIYDVNATQLSLTVADVTGNLPSGSCSFSLTLNKSNDLELSCSNTAEPCYAHISFNGAVVTNKTRVTYQTSQLTTDVVTGILDLSYSVCTNTSYIPGNNCSVMSKPDETTTETTSTSSNTTATDVTTATTESASSSSNADDASTTTTELSSSSPHTTAPPQPDPVCDTKCIVIIVVVVVIIIGVVAAVAIYCWKMKKRSKAVSNQGTNGNGDQAHTGENHKKDSHHTEHRNQAYDGRRSSPSEVTIHGVKTTTNDNVPQRNKAHEKDSNKPTSGRTNDDNASQSVPGNPRQLPPLKGTHTHGQLHPPAVSRPASVEITSTHQL